MAKKVYLNEAFIMAVDIQDFDFEKQNEFIKYLKSEHFGFDPFKHMDCIEFRCICDDFTDAAKLETWLNTH